jgi:hypothetical protein
MSDFFELLERLPDSVRDVMDSMETEASVSLDNVRGLARQHQAPEHVVLAFAGYLPDAKGNLVNAYCTTRNLYILDEAHKAAWLIHRMASRPHANIIWSTE